MTYHCYSTRINDDTWQDMKRIKQLDGRSFNSLINEGLHLIRQKKLQELSMRRKEKTSLASSVGW